MAAIPVYVAKRESSGIGLPKSRGVIAQKTAPRTKPDEKIFSEGKLLAILMRLTKREQIGDGLS